MGTNIERPYTKQLSVTVDLCRIFFKSLKVLLVDKETRKNALEVVQCNNESKHFIYISLMAKAVLAMS